MEFDAMNRIVEEVKDDLELERDRIMDEIIDEFPSTNSEQVENEANRRMLDQYVNAFIEKFKLYMIFYYNIRQSDLYKAIVDLKDEKMTVYEDEHGDGMTHARELQLLLKTIEEQRDMYENLFD